MRREEGSPGVTSMGAEHGWSRIGLDRDERGVKDAILRMGSLVELQIRDGVRAIVERDADLAQRVVEGDARVNEAQREISEAVVSTIATQSPVARDLRFLMALDHVAIELERIGDHASGIAKQALRIGLEAPLPALADVARMGEIAADQVRAVIEALIDVDEARARLVAAGDDEIDHGYRMVFADVVEQMRHDPRTVERGTRLILAAHWIERIGDRVTNVAEDVVYLTSGTIEDLN